MKLRKFTAGLYIYGDWMIVRLKMGWGLCTSWEYEQDEHGLGCSWAKQKYAKDFMHKIRPVHFTSANGHAYQAVRSTRGSVLSIATELEEGGEIAPLFSKADLYYLRTQRLEDVPRLLAKWPNSRQLAKLLTDINTEAVCL